MKTMLMALFLVLICVPAFAATITLKNGTVFEGKIVESKNHYIKVDRGVGVNLTYYRDEIYKISGHIVEGEVRQYTRSEGQGKIGLWMPNGSKMDVEVDKNTIFEGERSIWDVRMLNKLKVICDQKGDTIHARSIRFIAKIEEKPEGT